MLKNAWNEIANWRTKRQSNCTKSQPFVKLERKNLNQLENYQKCAHKLSYIACIQPEMVDLTFYGQSTNLPGQSQNGLKLLTDVGPD